LSLPLGVEVINILEVLALEMVGRTDDMKSSTREIGSTHAISSSKRH
jgi:hypothetical protein